MAYIMKQMLQLILCMYAAQSFSPSFQLRHSQMCLHGKGRSLEEVGLSKSAVFKKFKMKFNEFAKTPGFFDTGKILPNITISVISSKDGRQVGASPYTQFIQLLLLKKNLRYEQILTKPSDIHMLHPDIPRYNSILNFTDKSKPEISLHNVFDILDYLDNAYPRNNSTYTTYSSDLIPYRQIASKVEDLFETAHKYISNNNTDEDVALHQVLMKQLLTLDELMRAYPGKFLGGIDQGYLDWYIFPQLYHIMVGLEHFKPVNFYHPSNIRIPLSNSFMTTGYESTLQSPSQRHMSADQEGDNFVRGNFTKHRFNMIFTSINLYMSRMFHEISEFMEKPVFCSIDSIVNSFKSI